MLKVCASVHNVFLARPPHQDSYTSDSQMLSEKWLYLAKPCVILAGLGIPPRLPGCTPLWVRCFHTREENPLKVLVTEVAGVTILILVMDYNCLHWTYFLIHPIIWNIAGRARNIFAAASCRNLWPWVPIPTKIPS